MGELARTFIIELRKNCWPLFVVSEQIVENVHRKWGCRKLRGLNRRRLKKHRNASIFMNCNLPERRL